MAMLVAPVVVQLKVLLEPEVTLAGVAVKELIAGVRGQPEELPDPQPDKPITANRIGTRK
jgi:hypothetical protein